MKRASLTMILSTVLLAACGAPPDAGAGDDSAAVSGKTDSVGGAANVIWFGEREVESGRLKSANGHAPKAGSSVTLQLFLQQLSPFLCRDYCAATGPHLFVRYDGGSSFTEVPSLPPGYLPFSGGPALWDAADQNYHYDVTLSLPSNADRIEVYMYWDRESYSCVLESDETCTVNGPIDGAYLSNYGHNFAIAVR